MVQLLYKSVFYLIRDSVSLSHNILYSLARSLALSMLLSLLNGQRYYMLYPWLVTTMQLDLS